MNKRFLNLALWMLFSAVLCGTGCSDDVTYPDVDGQEPVATLKTTHIQSGAGHDFTIEGTLTDADGISSIKLECADLNLNKTIDLITIYGEPQKSYELSYKFNILADEIGEQFTVKVTVTDVGGRSTSQYVLVTMDGDFEAPKFAVVPGEMATVLLAEGTTPKYTLNITATDDRAIDYILVDIAEIAENLKFSAAEGNELELKISEEFTLPDQKKDYAMAFTVVDKAGKSTVAESLLSVTDVKDFEKMYLADVETVEALNSDVFGVPMRIDHVGEFKYEAYYYNMAVGTKIYFLPQKTDFTPVCFGLDPTDETKLINKASKEGVNPIVLDQANVYYKITLDILNKTYEMKTYSTADAQDPWASNLKYDEPTFDLWGDGGEFINFTFGLTSSNPTEVESFTQDATNPHLFYSDLDVAAGAMNFIIHNYHKSQWWNAVRWCSDTEKEPEVFGYYEQSASKNPNYTGPKTGADVWSKPEVQTAGKYRFYFDSHLGRAKLVKK